MTSMDSKDNQCKNAPHYNDMHNGRFNKTRDYGWVKKERKKERNKDIEREREEETSVGIIKVKEKDRNIENWLVKTHQMSKACTK